MGLGEFNPTSISLRMQNVVLSPANPGGSNLRRNDQPFTSCPGRKLAPLVFWGFPFIHTFIRSICSYASAEERNG